MVNYDLSIDQARAEKWKNDVDVEIERVQELLKKVAAIQMTIPGDDDPIMQGITNVCENLESFLDLDDQGLPLRQQRGGHGDSEDRQDCRRYFE